MNYGKNVGIVPLTDAAGITQPFKAGSHYGIDIGWHGIRNCDVLAWQDGKVAAKGYYSDTGYYVALEHNYSGNKRWTCYIHLNTAASVSVGQSVKLGQPIGRRGSSGNSTGEHLHFYLTKEIKTSLSFSFSNLKANAVNPVPYLYYSKEYNTIYISPDWTKPLPEPLPDIVQPVERDKHKDQLIVHDDGLRVRTSPSLSGENIGHLQKDKYYNFYEIVEAEGYKWYKLADRQYCAGIEELEVIPAEPDELKLLKGDRLEVIEYDDSTITFKIIRKE